jgi:hypothetical protein
MKMEWGQFVGKTLNITMFENYGVVYGKEKGEHPTFYEIVFKTGKLAQAFDEGLLLDTHRDDKTFQIFIPYGSIKCVEIF